MELLGRLNYNIGTTIIVVTHNYKMASLTGRILFLEDGKLLKKEKKGTYLGRKE